jgi:hypothetical protein
MTSQRRGRAIRGQKRQGNGIATEHYGVVVSLRQLDTIEAPVLPGSNQITATLFDKGRNDTDGERP